MKKNREREAAYCKFIDDRGNVLKPDEIEFLRVPDELLLDDTEDLEVRTIASADVNPPDDMEENFPDVLYDADHNLYRLKRSKKTGELLPMHAGQFPMLSLIFIGPAAAGKTLYFLQLSSESFKHAVAAYTGVSIFNDMPDEMESFQKNSEKCQQFMEYQLPEPTKRGEDVPPIYFRIHNQEKNNDILMKLKDIDGEACCNMQWEDSKIFHHDYLILMIPADDITASGQTVENISQKVLEQLMKRLPVLRREQDYELLVVITKADRLKSQENRLKSVFENSIHAEKDFRLIQDTHAKGFNFETFKNKNSEIQAFMEEEVPNLYNEIRSIVPKEHLAFFMIASIGEECEDTFESYQPLNIDEPFLYILAREGIYPTAVQGEQLKTEEVAGLVKHERMEKKRKVNFRTMSRRFLKALMLDE